MADESPRILRVAVAGPMPHVFDYLTGGAEGAVPGMRVLVPFGRRNRLGVVVDLASETHQPLERLRPAEALLDPHPLLGPADLDLLLWAADYYREAPGEALFTALPARLRQPQALLEAGEPGWRVTPEGRAAPLESLLRAPRQKQALTHLRSAGPGLSAAEVRRRMGDCTQILRALAKRGWVEPCRLTGNEQPLIAHPGPTLNPHQKRAVEAVRAALGGFAAFLLEGVTGSGKTEVYIRLLEAVLCAGDQALVLVPEIGLTPQLQQRLERRLAVPMAILHSGLSAAERERAWRQAATGATRLVLGTRSAIFTPLPRLALILVDEEHDLSFKQQDGFRYSARDLAVRRAQRAGCPVVLGSATPSLESLNNAARGRYRLLDLPERAGGALAPELAVLDIRGQPLRGGLSPVLVELMREQFAAGSQVLLFLNRRGFAPVLTCHDCGWVGECPRCDARLTLHLADERLWCHHCGLSRPLPHACPACKGTDLRPLGRGTERMEEELRGLFPDTPLARVDRDSTRRKGQLKRLLAAARAGEYPLLFGTQMLAKGHHFPDVTLVGILDLDQGLYGADYRAPERMAQLVVQVAGRAGRAQRPGRVVLQTRHPDHPLLTMLRRRGYPAFAAAALEERRAAGLPPFSFQALLRAEGRERAQAIAFLHQAVEEARTVGVREVELFGPVPAPMERRAGRYRAQLLLQAAERPALQRLLVAWTPRLYALEGRGKVRWSLDVDPQEML